MLIFRITNHLKAIKNQSKRVEDLPILNQLERLKGLNPAMAEDFEKQLKNLTKGAKPKQQNQMNKSFRDKWTK